MEKDSETIQEMERCSTSYKKRKKFYLIIIFVLLTFLTIPFFYVIKDFIQWGGFTGKNENLYKLIICLFITILIFLYLLIRNKRDSKSSNVYLGKGIVVLLVILNFGVIFFPSHYLNERFSDFNYFTAKEKTSDKENTESVETISGSLKSKARHLSKSDFDEIFRHAFDGNIQIKKGEFVALDYLTVPLENPWNPSYTWGHTMDDPQIGRSLFLETPDFSMEDYAGKNIKVYGTFDHVKITYPKEPRNCYLNITLSNVQVESY